MKPKTVKSATPGPHPSVPKENLSFVRMPTNNYCLTADAYPIPKGPRISVVIK